MAILLALFLKAFIVEAYKIPSGSMQPTLMGMPAPGDVVASRSGGPPPAVNDRILVDKASYKFRDPRRWEVVVFRYPLKRTQNFVKRLVGMPGEQFRIYAGDIWTRAESGDPWQVERRPRAVQENHWRPAAVPEGARQPWTLTRGSGWSLAGDSILSAGDGAVRFGEGAAVLDLYFDGYPEAVRTDLPARHPTKERLHPVGDLRLSGSLRPSAQTRSVTLVLSEGPRRYSFTLLGPAGEGELPAIRVEPANALAPASVGGEELSRAAPQLRADRRVEFAVENLDDRLTFRVDGEEVAAVEVLAATDQQSGVAIEVQGGAVQFEDLLVERDIYYFSDRETEFVIPPGQYLMLGDNTLNSSDGREWERGLYRSQQDPERLIEGNLRLGDNPSRSVLDPQFGRFFRFTDEWGTHHLLQEDRLRAPDQAPAWLERVDSLPKERQPFVDRELIVGRALAVFWPIAPLKGLYRLRWVE
jgi:signal peptidase I